MACRGQTFIAAVVAAAVVAMGVTSASAQAPEEPAAAGAGTPAPSPATPDPRQAAGTSQQPGNGSPGPRKSTVKLRLKGLSGGRLKAGEKFTAAGTLRPFAKGERVTMYLKRGKKTIDRKTMYAHQKKKGSKLGQFHIKRKLIKPGRYWVLAVHGQSPRLSGSKDRTRAFKMRYPDLNPGNRNSKVKLFNQLLAKRGYVNDRGSAYDAATERAVLAFHKVNQKSWTTNATGGDFKKLAKGKGGYKLRYPNSGKHVEVDISRQVMVLAKGDRVDEIYHISSGASATPTPPGTWRFYRKEPGYNNKEMYYSVYWNRGYATHGYKSVPTYPASHGCVRNPPANSIHIYNWIDIGDLIHIYP